MNGSAADFDGDFWIENAYSGLEGFKSVVLVRKETKDAGFDTKANACRNIFLCRLEPGVALSLDGGGEKGAWRARRMTWRASAGTVAVAVAGSECSTGVYPSTHATPWRLAFVGKKRTNGGRAASGRWWEMVAGGGRRWETRSGGRTASMERIWSVPA
jgi:hypothetical protein